MFKRIMIALFLIVSIFSICESFPQENKKSAYLSFGAGPYVAFAKGFQENFGSKMGLAYSIGTGFDIGKGGYSYIRLTYFNKKGTPLIRRFSFKTQTDTFITGSSDFTQWILNLGLGSQFSIYKDINGGIFVGGHVSRVYETSYNSSGSQSYIGGNIALGFFTAATIEKIIWKSIAIAGELRWNAARTFFIKVNNYGSVDFSLGIKYMVGKGIQN